MAVTILRKTGLFGPFGKLLLLVQDEEITEIANNQTVTFDLPIYPTYLNVKGDPKSAILVNNHEKYILCTHPLFQWCQIFAISLLILSLMIEMTAIKWLLFLICILLSIVANFFLPRYCFKAMIGPKIKIKEFC